MPDAQGKPTDAELRQQIISALSSDVKAKPAKAEELEILRDPEGNPLGYRDLATGAYFPIPRPPAPRAPDTTSPAETTWVDVAGPLQQGQQPMQQGHRIVEGQLVPIPGLMRAKSADDKTSGTPQWIPDPQDATKEIQVVYSGTTALPVQSGGAVVSRVKKTEPGAGPSVAGAPTWVPDPQRPGQEIQVLTVVSPDGTPSSKPTGATRKAEATAPTAAGNVIWQDIPDQPGKQQGGLIVEGRFVPTEGLTKDKEAKPVAVYGTGQNDRWRISLDEKGNVVSKEENPNYQPQPGTQLTADATAANIPILKPDGTVTWVPNQNRVPIGQAMADLMQQAGMKVNAGEMSMADAKDMLTGTVNLMNAQTARTSAENAQQTAASTAAQNIISNEQTQRTQGAQTGAGMLNQRVQAAQGMLGQVLGLANGGQRSGNMGGGLMNAPAGLGEALIGGIGGWTAELGGGQGVYDTAARMVTAADPQNGRSPEAQAAYGVLTQMLDRFQQQTGQPHPAVMATQAAQRSTASNGFVPPSPTPTPAPSFQYDPRFQPDMPQQLPGTLLPPGVAGTVPPGDPRYRGTQPVFIAPVTVEV